VRARRDANLALVHGDQKFERIYPQREAIRDDQLRAARLEIRSAARLSVASWTKDFSVLPRVEM
jgi:hypothetical protein